MKTGIILLARTGSTRLPGKVLKEISGRTVTEHVVRRLRKVRGVDEIILATTLEPDDDALEQLADQLGIGCYRGERDNVLQRCIGACKAFGLDVVIRLGADCPVTDWEVIGAMLTIFQQSRTTAKPYEYVSNTMHRCFPLGLDAEVFAAETFNKIDQLTAHLPDEERKSNESNVIPFLHQHRELFSTYSYEQPFDHSQLRWTLDTPEDFDLITKIYEALYPHKPDFLMADILKLLELHPNWSAINASIVPVTGYWTASEQAKLARQLEQKA